MIKRVIIEKAERLQKLPPSPFLEAERIKKTLRKRGVEIIDLGELYPDPSLREAILSSFSLKREEFFASVDPHEWAELKIKIADWLEQKYQVRVNPKNEIFPFAGKKKIIYDFFLSFLNPGEVVAIPDPSDHIYKGGSIFAGGEVVSLPLHERNDYLPNLDTLPSSEHAPHFPKILFLNYPHNPTTAVADLEFFKESVKWASKRNVLLVNDASYNEICYDGYLPTCLLQVKGAKKIGAELFFFYPLTGIGFGFLAGNKQIVSQGEATAKVFGYQLSHLMLELSLLILKNYSIIAQQNNLEFAKRKEILLEGLLNLGWKVKKPKAGPFVWVKVPPRYSSVGFARMLLRKAGVLVSPGFGFGEYGEGYIRIALNQKTEELKKALERIKEHSHIWQRRYRPKKTNT
ncbi:MAG: aminotransferase class I/II-fold pyridoxal phosphate-dependent enzyme [candidate division Zixibacteria bacterium]|nr:aminotransferase class I/II-fold pyridoxal phosphate-dependent enzyme [candidate division Zixibacteria bacterium]